MKDCRVDEKIFVLSHFAKKQTFFCKSSKTVLYNIGFIKQFIGGICDGKQTVIL